MFTEVFLCLLMSIDVYWCLLMSIDVYWCLFCNMFWFTNCVNLSGRARYWCAWFCLWVLRTMNFIKGCSKDVLSSRRSSIQSSGKGHRSRTAFPPRSYTDREQSMSVAWLVTGTHFPDGGRQWKKVEFMKSQRFSIFFHGFLDWELVFVFFMFLRQDAQLVPSATLFVAISEKS